jgi:hypothetical protein
LNEQRVRLIDEIMKHGSYSDFLRLSKDMRLGDKRKYRRVTGYQPLTIPVPIDSGPDPFSDGIRQYSEMVVVRNVAVPHHGGSCDGKTMHIQGPLYPQRIWRVAVAPDILRMNFDDVVKPFEAEITITNEVYDLVMIGNEPHYFYSPKV